MIPETRVVDLWHVNNRKFDDVVQLSGHFFNHVRVRGTIDRSRCDHQQLLNRGDHHPPRFT